MSSEKYSISVTVIERVSASQNYPQFHIQCIGQDSLQSLRDEIHSHLNKSSSTHVYIAFKGKLLKQNDASLLSLGVTPTEHVATPKIFVTLKDSKPNTKTIKSRATRQSENESEWQMIDSSHSNEAKSNADALPTHTQAQEQAPAEEDTNNSSTVPNSSDIVDMQYENLTGDEDDHKQCRLCFSSEEDNAELGQLFQPCLCSGTMRWIHVRCLNEWRAVAPNQRSYYRCDQCQYAYNLRRAQWADLVAHDYTVKTISVIILSVAVAVFGVVTYKLPIADYAYNAMQWSPIVYFSHKTCHGPFKAECEYVCNSWFPWNECPAKCLKHNSFCFIEPMDGWTEFYIQVIFSGVLVMALLGLYTIKQLVWRHKWVFLATLAQSTRIWRLFILVGIGHSFYSLLNRVRVYVKQFLFKFGERILSVDHTT